MSEAVLCLGSNLGDREHYLKAARENIGILPGTQITTTGRILETAPLEVTDQPAFLNQLILLKTNLPPEELLSQLLAIEDKYERERRIDKGPRTLDIDILMYEDVESKTERLQLPHPAVTTRPFVKTLLAELKTESGSALIPAN